MNIRDILRLAGYDILEENIESRGVGEWRFNYQVRFNLETRRRKRAEMEAGTTGYKIDIDGIHDVYIDDVGFNGWGDLYISLAAAEDNSCFDVIEFEDGKVLDRD